MIHYQTFINILRYRKSVNEISKVDYHWKLVTVFVASFWSKSDKKTSSWKYCYIFNKICRRSSVHSQNCFVVTTSNDSARHDLSCKKTASRKIVFFFFSTKLEAFVVDTLISISSRSCIYWYCINFTETHHRVVVGTGACLLTTA